MSGCSLPIETRNGGFGPAGLLAALLSVLLMVAGCSRSTTFPSRREANQRIAEITAVQAGFRSPVPDPSGHYLAYVQAVGPGRRLFVFDVTAGTTRPVPTANDVSQVFGWSADHHYLAFAQAPPVAPRADDPRPAAWLTLYDWQTGAVQRLGTNENVQEASAAWLEKHTLFYSQHVLGDDGTEKFIADLDAHATRQVTNYVTDFVLAGPNKAAFFLDGNIQTCALDSTNFDLVSNFPSNTFDMMKWLQFRRDTGTYLFCARKTNSQWRCLYEFDPASQQLKQLTTRGAYNGQCLGTGYAYVGNTSNEFYLALRPADPALATNLFRGGNVITYAASADGSAVFAVASEKTEPQSLWWYDVAKRDLRKLVSSQPQPWRAARLVPPQAKWTKSFDGVVIPYFVIPPAELADHPHTNKKFPVMVYLPPSTWQFQRAFDLPAEFYANLNCWYLAVNYRGGDGYGRAYNDLHNTTDAAKDVLVALARLGAGTNVDLQRVMLISQSNGANVALELLNNFTNHWRGAILEHPEPGVLDTLGVPLASPPLFIVAGDLEKTAGELADFVALARQSGISTQLIIQKNTGHEVWSTDQTRATLREEWKFVRRWME